MPHGLTSLASTVTVPPLAVSATRFLAANTLAAVTVSVADILLLVGLE